MKKKILVSLSLVFYLSVSFGGAELCLWCVANNCDYCLTEEPDGFADIDNSDEENDSSRGGEGGSSWPSNCKLSRQYSWPGVIDFAIGDFDTTVICALTKMSAASTPTVWLSHTTTDHAEGTVSLFISGYYATNGLVEYVVMVSQKMEIAVGASFPETTFFDRFDHFQFPGSCY